MATPVMSDRERQAMVMQKKKDEAAQKAMLQAQTEAKAQADALLKLGEMKLEPTVLTKSDPPKGPEIVPMEIEADVKIEETPEEEYQEPADNELPEDLNAIVKPVKACGAGTQATVPVKKEEKAKLEFQLDTPQKAWACSKCQKCDEFQKGGKGGPSACGFCGCGMVFHLRDEEEYVSCIDDPDNEANYDEYTDESDD